MAANDDIPKFIRRVLSNASEAELREATTTFDDYMALVWEIFQRIERERVADDSPNTSDCDRFEDINERL
jgi:hypothetical protein